MGLRPQIKDLLRPVIQFTDMRRLAQQRNSCPGKALFLFRFMQDSSPPFVQGQNAGIRRSAGSGTGRNAECRTNAQAANPCHRIAPGCSRFQNLFIACFAAHRAVQAVPESVPGIRQFPERFFLQPSQPREKQPFLLPG